MISPCFLAAVLALGSQPASSARPLARAGQQQPGSESADAEAWRALVERDQRVSFPAFCARAAQLELGREDLPAARRALAMVVLGSCGSESERAALESWSLRGSPEERLAATLGLGALGPRSASLLLRLANEAEPVQAACALLALLRSGDPAGADHVRELAAASDHPLAQTARRLLAFQADPCSSAPTDAARLWLELRFEAARRYGLIDGKTWRTLLSDELERDEAFLDRFVYRAATGLMRPGVRDHFLALVTEGTCDEGLRAAMEVILPTEIAEMVAAGVWTPSSVQWAVMLAAIEEQHVEALSDPLLDQALALEEHARQAALLYLRAGDLRGRSALEQELGSAGPQQRSRMVEGLGASGMRNFLSSLVGLAEDPDPTVRAAALVAQARLGNEGAKDRIEILLSNEELARLRVPREILVEALARACPDAAALSLLSEALPYLSGPARIRAATALVGAGREEGAEILRAALRASPPTGPEGAQRVAALARQAQAEDRELLRELFPLPGEPEVNAELALALLRQGDGLVAPLLRSALWRGPFHRSVLAGGLLADALGIDALRTEVESPPRSARPEALRRAGFALGEWGGPAQVEALARRFGASDPRLQGALLGALSARTH